MGKIEQEEEWKWLYSSTSHQVSNQGRFRSVDRVTIGKDGRVTQRHGRYICLRCTKKEPHLFASISFFFVGQELSSGQTTVYIHKAVADHFVPKPSIHDSTISEFNYQYVSHINKDYTNNTPENLVWKTFLDLIRSQPKRLANPKRAWETRKELYGKTGTSATRKKETEPRKKRRTTAEMKKAVALVEIEGVLRKMTFPEEDELVYNVFII